MGDNAGTENTTHVYVVSRGGIDIDAPVERVWPRVLEYASWQNYAVQEHVSGEPGGEGEVVLLIKDEDGGPTTPYYARTVKIVPGERIIWKTFRDEPDYMGIVEFEVHDTGDGTTRFAYRNFYEHVLPTTDPAQVESFRREREAGMAALSSKIFPRLKQAAEAA